MDNRNNNQSDYVLDEMKKLIKRQNALIVKQNNMISKMINDYRLMRILCYTLIAVTAIVFALVPAGYLVYDGLKGFLETPSLWGAVLIVALLAFMVLLLVLAGFLRKHSTDYEEIIEIEEDENDDN